MVTSERMLGEDLEMEGRDLETVKSSAPIHHACDYVGEGLC